MFLLGAWPFVVPILALIQRLPCPACVVRLAFWWAGMPENLSAYLGLPVYLCYLPLGICFDNDMKVLCFLTVQDSKRRQAFIRASLYRLNVYTLCRLHLAELSCLIAGGNLPDPCR